MTQKTLLVAGALAVVLGTALGLSDRSVVAAEGAAPKIAFVDIEKVLEDSIRAKETEKILNTELRRIEDEFQKAQQGVAARAEELDKLRDTSPEHRDLKYALALEGHSNKLKAQSEREALQIRARDEMANIYKEIRSVVAAYAAKHGIDAVLTVNNGEPEGKTLPDVRFEIAMRPVLFAHKDFEITDAILAILNETK